MIRSALQSLADIGSGGGAIDAERLVDAAEVVVHEVERDRALQAFDFLLETIRFVIRIQSL